MTYEFAYCWASGDRIHWSAEKTDELPRRTNNDEDLALIRDFIDAATPGSFIVLRSGEPIFCVSEPVRPPKPLMQVMEEAGLLDDEPSANPLNSFRQKKPQQRAACDFAYCWASGNKANWSAETADTLIRRTNNDDDRDLALDFTETAAPGSFITLESGALVFCMNASARTRFSA